jgi:hypothetical protein
MKERQMQLKAGAKSRRGGNAPGPARDYSIKELREQERALVEQAERAYTRFVSAWSEKSKSGRSQAVELMDNAGRCPQSHSSRNSTHSGMDQ